MKIKQLFIKYCKDLVHLIYPSLCIICENELSNTEKNICSYCYEDLAFTGFEYSESESKLDKLFWGRVLVKYTFSLLFFEKTNSTQKLVHQIKYKNRSDLAYNLGSLIALSIKKSNIKYNDLDFLVPVPLHINKKFIRGYNQSEIIAKGIEKELNIKVNNKFLQRIRHSESQTKKNKFIRWDNVQETFSVQKNLKEPKHIAIIDDVITTGSTLEACINEINKVYPSTTISVFSLACVK